MAEYHLLQREFRFSNNVITLLLENPVEEPLLLSLKADLLTFLREKLNNSTLQIESVLETIQTKRIVYTNKEKLEHLIEKNPLLKDLQERMGLDPDF